MRLYRYGSLSRHKVILMGLLFPRKAELFGGLMIAEIQSHPVLPLRTQEGLVLKRVLWYKKQPLMIVRVNSKESIFVGGFAQEANSKTLQKV